MGRAASAFSRARQGTEQQRPGMARAAGGELAAGDWKGLPVRIAARLPARPASLPSRPVSHHTSASKMLAVAAWTSSASTLCCLCTYNPKTREKKMVYDWSIFHIDTGIKFGIEKDGFLLQCPML